MKTVQSKATARRIRELTSVREAIFVQYNIDPSAGMNEFDHAEACATLDAYDASPDGIELELLISQLTTLA